jgi:hypothetical protein
MVIVLLAFLVTWFVLMVVAIGVFWWHLDRRNRVSVHHPTTAPLTWLGWPTKPARMHRRLRNAVAPIDPPAPKRRRRSRPLRGSADALRRELVLQAVELDRHVVLASRQPRYLRAQMLEALDAQIREVEHLSLRIGALVQAPGAPASGWDSGPTPQQALADIAERVAHLEHAHAELAHIERASGLIDPGLLDSRALPGSVDSIAYPSLADPAAFETSITRSSTSPARPESIDS